MLDFNNTLGAGASIITEAATHNPNIECLSFSGCSLSSSIVTDIVRTLREGPMHTVEFIDLDRNYMNAQTVDELIALLTSPTNHIERITLDSL